MRILLVNDDGIDAPGLAALERACMALGGVAAEELFIVAPSDEASQIGHRVTTAVPIRVERRDPQRFAVAGTPADCTRLALDRLLPEPPDLVLSGINAGGNLGQDIVISGTVAAAREAAYHGVPAVAISHYMRAGVDLCWDSAARRVTALLEWLLNEELSKAALADGEFLNVNLPHLAPDGDEPTVIATFPERAPLPVAFDETPDGFRYVGRYADRPRLSAESDVSVCFGGDISLTRLNV